MDRREAQTTPPRRAGGKQRTGTVRPHGDHWDVRVYLGKGRGKTKWIHLKRERTEEDARALAAEWSQAALEGRLVFDDTPPAPVPVENTVAGWAARWFEHRTLRGYDTRPDASRWGKWIDARWGGRPLASITTVEIEALVAHLDAEVIAERLAWKSAVNVWGLVTKAFDDATRAKEQHLRILTKNPATDVRGPYRGATKAREHLAPHEFLMAVSDDRAPVLHRRVVAVDAYLYLRPGELAALEWGDVDIKGGVVTVHQALSREDAIKATKTDEPRLVPIEATLLPLLRAMHDEADGVGRVFPTIPDEENLARWFRRLLHRAGVDRASLHESTATRRAIRFYDLRATGITWRLIRGDEPFHVKEDAGHRRFETTQVYARRARVLRAQYGEVFPQLPASLLVAQPGSTGHGSSDTRGLTSRNDGGERGIRTHGTSRYT